MRESGSDGPLRVETHANGSLLRLVLARPKANVLDAAMTRALTAAVRAAAPPVKALVLEGEGPSFSYGASVEEHQPGQVGAMLSTFHELFRALLAASLPVLAAVRGQCLGGGLELAAFANRLIAAPDAKLGQPEVKLGVVAPVASLILPERMGRGAAEDLLLSGRTISAEAGLALGLVDEVAADPWQAAQDWFRQHLEPHSASSLRLAVKAARLGFGRRFLAELEAVELLYRAELMATADAVEGIDAFLHKRPPAWRNA